MSQKSSIDEDTAVAIVTVASVEEAQRVASLQSAQAELARLERELATIRDDDDDDDAAKSALRVKVAKQISVVMSLQPSAHDSVVLFDVLPIVSATTTKTSNDNNDDDDNN